MKNTPTSHKNPLSDSRISIIIPVYRETDTIKKTLACLAESAARHRAQIIVVDGEPGAGTIAVIGEEPLITTLVSRRGRACQMNAGADRATGDILLFLHADTILPGHALESVIAVCRNDAIVGGAFDLSIDSNKPAYRII
jgi:glycosyltransferase involved in cell wall biosynthesis